MTRKLRDVGCQLNELSFDCTVQPHSVAKRERVRAKFCRRRIQCVAFAYIIWVQCNPPSANLCELRTNLHPWPARCFGWNFFGSPHFHADATLALSEKSWVKKCSPTFMWTAYRSAILAWKTPKSVRLTVASVASVNFKAQASKN